MPHKILIIEFPIIEIELIIVSLSHSHEWSESIEMDDEFSVYAKEKNSFARLDRLRRMARGRIEINMNDDFKLKNS